jgi:nitrite reductase/ring-hydroxylating ferredoxin subunit
MAALAFGSMFLAIYMNGSSPKAEAEGAQEVEVSFASELHDGDKRVLKVGEKDDDVILIAKYQGKIYAVGNFCSHFGVPLDGGVLFDDKVLCPAHAAGFSIITGQPDGGPGLDGLPSFPVVQRDGKHFVQIAEGALKARVTMPLTKRDPNNHTHFVIIGGGAAGLNAAETLRQSGFTGQITLLTNENQAPYDRTLLTKAVAVGDPSKWKLRSD